MKKIFTLLVALLVGGAVASAENVVFIGDTGYETLDAALTAVKDGETINITGNTEWKNAWTPTVSNITIQAEQGVTISCYLKNKRAITLNNSNPRTVTLKNLHLDYVEKDASDRRLIEASKGVLNMENCKISNFKHNKTQDVILVSGGTGKLTNVVFENSELTAGLGEIRVGGNNLTISGTTNGSLNVEGTDRYVTVEGSMNPAAPIKVIVPENRAAGKAIVKNCTDVSKFDLQSDALVLKVKDNDIITSIKPVIYIGETSYDTLKDAVDAAQEGDVIMLNGDISVGERVTFAKNVTIQGIEGGEKVKIISTINNNIPLLFNSAATIKSVNVVYNRDDESSRSLIESTGAGNLYMEDCEISNYKGGNGQNSVCAKGDGKVHLKNVLFINNTVKEGRGEIYFGSNGSTIDGTTNGSIMVQNDNTFSVGSEFNPAIRNDPNATAVESVPAENAVKLYFDGARTEGSDVVLGTEDPTKFNLQHDALELVAKDGKLVAQKKTSVGIAGIEADGNAPVEYFNLNGVQVKTDNMTPGVYVRCQGKNVTKVMVK